MSLLIHKVNNTINLNQNADMPTNTSSYPAQTSANDIQDIVLSQMLERAQMMQNGKLNSSKSEANEENMAKFAVPRQKST